MIIPKYYEDLKTLHVNTMPNRAYYIPASGRMDNPTGEREESDRFTLTVFMMRRRNFSGRTLNYRSLRR